MKTIWGRTIIMSEVDKFQELVKKYPKLFRHDAFYFEVGPGWFDLLDECFSKLVALEVGPVPKIDQCKEKFGGLRIYWSSDDSDDIPDALLLQRDLAVDQIIQAAVSKSFTTCETCGQPERLVRRRGWLTVACPEHVG